MVEQDQSLKIKSKKPNVAEPSSFDDLGVEYDEPAKNQSFDDLGVEYDEQKTPSRQNKNLITEAVEMGGETLKGIARGTLGIGSGASGLIDMAGQNIQKMAEESLYKNTPGVSKEERSAKAERLFKIGRKVSEWGKSKKDYFQKAMQEGIAAPDPVMFQGTFMQNPSWTRAATIVAEAVPSLGAATAVSMAAGGNPIVGLAFLGGVEGEQTFSESRSAGKSVDDANRLFGMSAIGTSVLEALPLTRFIKGGEGKLAKDVFVGAVQEGGEEGLQSLWQNIIARIGYDKTRSLTEGMVESVIGGAGSGGVMGGLTSGRAAKLDKEIKASIDAGVPPVAIEAMQDAVANQIVNNAEVIEKAITKKQTVKLEDVSTDVAKPAETISINVTPEMRDAVSSGAEVVDVKIDPAPADNDIIPGNAKGKTGDRTVMKKAIDDLNSGVITQEQFDDIAKTGLTIKQSAIEQKPAEVSDVDKNSKRVEAGAGVSESKEPVSQSKPEDFKTAEEYVASKSGTLDKIEQYNKLQELKDWLDNNIKEHVGG